MANEATRRRWRDEIAALGGRSERLRNTEYICRADGDFEVHQLWERYCCYLGIEWSSHNVSTVLQIGEIDQRPIMANVDFAELTAKRHLTAFVRSPSELTDHKMLSEWMEVAFPYVRASRDAWNFSHLIHHMAKIDGVENYFTRKPTLIDGLDESRDEVHPTLETVFPEMSLEDRFAFAERKMQAWGERARAYQDALKAGGAR